MLYIKQVDWFNYVSLLLWKVSNHEVSLLCITSLGFWCAIIDWISKSITWRTEHNWSVIQRLNEAYQPSCDSIFPVCVQPHFDNQTSQKTRKLSQLNNGEGVQISLQVVNSSVTKDFIVCLQSSIATVQPAVTWNFTHHLNEQSLTNCCWNCEKAIVQCLFQSSILHSLNSSRSANNLSSMLVRFLWLATEQQILICLPCLPDCNRTRDGANWRIFKQKLLSWPFWKSPKRRSG